MVREDDKTCFGCRVGTGIHFSKTEKNTKSKMYVNEKEDWATKLASM